MIRLLYMVIAVMATASVFSTQSQTEGTPLEASPFSGPANGVRKAKVEKGPVISEPGVRRIGAKDGKSRIVSEAAVRRVRMQVTAKGDANIALASKSGADTSEASIVEHHRVAPEMMTHENISTPALKAPARSEFQVIYGIESCDGPYFVDMVDAQLNTWAKDVPRENLLIVGGPRNDVAAGIETEHAFSCGDKQNDLACKEALLLWHAIDRIERLSAKWLVVSQDDKYLWRKALDTALLEFDADKPQVIAPFGCGRAWKHHPNSKNGTLPTPPGWKNPSYSCDAVYQNGGICGGSTYMISRGALKLLRKEGQTAAEFKKEYLLPKLNETLGGSSDLFSSCFFYRRSIPQGESAKINSRQVVAKYIEVNDPGKRGMSPLTVHVDTSVPKHRVADFILRVHREWNIWHEGPP